ncbi:MAG: DeoR/GlpR family DNA-binding transcription regulator [Planctomycetota bacterium]|jgi:DeoR/GlpR family transcriptional regulator of sugar metabolism
MLPSLRHREILSRLHADGSVRVSELASSLNVTEETIRRDLKKLEAEERLVRSHGGAIPLDKNDEEGSAYELPFDVRRVAKLPEKRRIAAAAASLISEGQTLALDQSTTCCELAKILPPVRLTVITSSPVIATLLVPKETIRVICTGGELDRTLFAYFGSWAEAALEHLHIDRAFFSCRGIDLQRGLSDPSDAVARFKKRMIGLAERSTLLADHTKFRSGSVVYYGRIGDVNEMICDDQTSSDVIHAFKTAGVATTVAGG